MMLGKWTSDKRNPGQWLVRVNGDADEIASLGQGVREVVVVKRNGDTQTVSVGRVIWTGQDPDGSHVALCKTVQGAQHKTAPAQQPQTVDTDDDIPF